MYSSVSWGGRREGLAWSTLFHIVVLFALGSLAALSDPVSRLGSLRFVLPAELSPAVLLVPASLDRLAGGGGGDHSPLPPSRGRPPRFRPDHQLAPPSTRPPERAALEVEPSLIGPAELNVHALDSAVIGSPFAQLGPPSNGRGSRGGIGTGPGGGIGPSGGPGMGPGPGGGISGLYSIGGGVTAPRLIHRVEPEYSSQARKNRWQGTVVLLIEVWPDGRAHNIRVVGMLGLGLDEKAVEAVRAWRFAPGTKDGKPVRVRARVEVSFRLL